MKKKYSIPRIIMEDFTLSESIAGNCGAAHNSNLGGPTHGDKNTCGWDLGGAILWSVKEICDEDSLVGEDGGVVCYNAPEGGYSIFSS